MNKIKNCRGLGFFAVAVVYIFAAAVGIIVYLALPFHFAINLLIADIAATVFTFIFSLIFKNASVYDPYWSVQPPVIVFAFAFAHEPNWFGILLLSAITFWAVRLTANWAYTFKGLSHQDWRYTMLCERTGIFYPVINFIGIHLVPTLVVYGCTLPAVYALICGYKGNAFGIVFCILAILSAALQGIADIQMHKFKRNRTQPFIRNGLWRYSRHPNYLGEILMWWSIGLAVFSASGIWLFLVGAACNTLLFLCVSIPLADGRQSKKDGWGEYKRQTRILLPIPRLLHCRSNGRREPLVSSKGAHKKTNLKQR